jgi:hypothetical protein
MASELLWGRHLADDLFNVQWSRNSLAGCRRHENLAVGLGSGPQFFYCEY